jgi:TrmH family RNA methyltransferase
MISKNRTKFIISLQNKKVRDEEQLFVIEGDKIVKEFLYAKVPVRFLVAKQEFLSALPSSMTRLADEIIVVSHDELKQVSSLKTPHNALAVVPFKNPEPALSLPSEELVAALENIQDPGNLGTIIRAAVWFGIKNIFCSPDCVDIYNPKVIQASMGALLHVNLFYYDLEELLITASEKKLPIFGALLEGVSIYDHKLDNKGIILLGNESRGISDNLKIYINEKIMIPSADSTEPGIDSLNVGMAASVIFSEFKRRAY